MSGLGMPGKKASTWVYTQVIEYHLCQEDILWQLSMLAHYGSSHNSAYWAA